MQVHTDASLKFQLKCKEKEKKVKAAVEKHGNRNHFEKEMNKKKILMRGSEKQGKKCSDPLFHA